MNRKWASLAIICAALGFSDFALAQSVFLNGRDIHADDAYYASQGVNVRAAYDIFPHIGQVRERAAWMSNELNEILARQNRVDVAKALSGSEGPPLNNPNLAPDRTTSVYVQHRGEVDLTSFDCKDITRSSFIDRVCYDSADAYMIVSLNGTYYHYCDIDNDTVEAFEIAPSMGHFYDVSIRGHFDCRIGHVPAN